MAVCPDKHMRDRTINMASRQKSQSRPRRGFDLTALRAISVRANALPIRAAAARAAFADRARRRARIRPGDYPAPCSPPMRKVAAACARRLDIIPRKT